MSHQSSTALRTCTVHKVKHCHDEARVLHTEGWCDSELCEVCEDVSQAEQSKHAGVCEMYNHLTPRRYSHRAELTHGSADMRLTRLCTRCVLAHLRPTYIRPGTMSCICLDRRSSTNSSSMPMGDCAGVALDVLAGCCFVVRLVGASAVLATSTCCIADSCATEGCTT